MTFIYPLCSSSKGNCTYIGTKEKGILIDAGIGIRGFISQFKLLGISLSAIRGIFVTHEHSDHTKGLKRIQQELNVPVLASNGTLQSLYNKQLIDLNKTIYKLNSGQEVLVADMGVYGFSTPHDSAESFAYKITTSNNKKVSVCTDLGHITESVHNHLKDCNTILLESNYEKSLLEMGSYPVFLKERILGKYGHLSNENCADEISRLINSGVEKFILGHLSQENNMPDIAYTNVIERLSRDKIQLDKDYSLKVAPVTNDGTIIEMI